MDKINKKELLKLKKKQERAVKYSEYWIVFSIFVIIFFIPIFWPASMFGIPLLIRAHSNYRIGKKKLDKTKLLLKEKVRKKK